MNVKITVDGKEIECSISEEQLKALGLVKEQQTPKGLWQPKFGEDYFTITTSGEVVSFPCCSSRNVPYYQVFKTEQEAEKYAEYIKAKHICEDAIAKFNDGWVPDWEDSCMYKHSIHKGYNKDLICSWSCKMQFTTNSLYFKSRDFFYVVQNSPELTKAFKTMLSY